MFSVSSQIPLVELASWAQVLVLQLHISLFGCALLCLSACWKCRKSDFQIWLCFFFNGQILSRHTWFTCWTIPFWKAGGHYKMDILRNGVFCLIKLHAAPSATIKWTFYGMEFSVWSHFTALPTAPPPEVTIKWTFYGTEFSVWSHFAALLIWRGPFWLKIRSSLAYSITTF